MTYGELDKIRIVFESKTGILQPEAKHHDARIAMFTVQFKSSKKWVALNVDRICRPRSRRSRPENTPQSVGCDGEGLVYGYDVGADTSTISADSRFDAAGD